MNQFTVRTENFEGPLELLLSLIEKRKLHINDISLAKVADDYIEHLHSLESFPIADSAHFVLVASTLVLIKSKSLLPSLSLTEEEKGDIEELEQRLKIYKRMRELGQELKSIYGKDVLYFKPAPKNIDPVFSPPPEATVPSLSTALIELIKNLPRVKEIPKAVVRKVISLEEMIGRLTTRVNHSLRMSFREFSGMGKEDKVNVIVGFLAMLELVKQGVIMVKQEQKYGDIEMETNSLDTPRYG